MLRAQSTTPALRAALTVFFLLAGFVLTGCGASAWTAGRSDAPHRVPRPADDVEPLLRQEVDRWRGTPHVLGGMTVNGIDCSAFVQRVFADALAVDLPRTTEEQVEVGERVNMSELQSGDLVFFQPPTKTNHVGIYLDDGEFAHVSSTSGVTVSELDLDYWRTSYWTSRRILDDEPPVAMRPVHVEATPRSDDPPLEPGRRVGW